jgi:hypothetical protein
MKMKFIDAKESFLIIIIVVILVLFQKKSAKSHLHAYYNVTCYKTARYLHFILVRCAFAASRNGPYMALPSDVQASPVLPKPACAVPSS